MCNFCDSNESQKLLFEVKTPSLQEVMLAIPIRAGTKYQAVSSITSRIYQSLSSTETPKKAAGSRYSLGDLEWGQTKSPKKHPKKEPKNVILGPGDIGFRGSDDIGIKGVKAVCHQCPFIPAAHAYPYIQASGMEKQT